MNWVTRAERRQLGQPALDLIEEAVGLLRRAPAETIFLYLLGAIPFWLALLYFLSDMSRNAYAALHISESSLAVSLLYIWMKCWQTVFCARLRTILSEQPGERWTLGRVARMALAQAAWQPWGFLVRPLAALITIPYGWVVVFFQNLTVLGDGSAYGGEYSLGARAWWQARLWPRQAHIAVGVLWIFGFFVWINVVAVLGFAPIFLKMFFAIETAFSRSVDAYFNTTFVTASFALTALVVDPLWKAIFVLRCFRGGALRTGEDLAVELKQARRMAHAPALALITFVLCFASPISSMSAVPSEPAPVEAKVLDQRIGEVLTRREYAWRAPREKIPEEQNVGWFRAWLRGINKAIEASFKAAARAVKRVIDAIYNKFFNRSFGSTGTWDWVGAAKATLVLLGIAGVVAIAWMLWRLFRGGHVTKAVTAAVAAIPDLRAEDVAADQLPEDGWLRLAREHAGRGELQLALRAAWLAGLAHLGTRQLLSIARHKSNRDYDRELRRRARTRDALLHAFEQNLTAFERSWYGRHPVRPDDFTAFEGNLARIREC